MWVLVQPVQHSGLYFRTLRYRELQVKYSCRVIYQYIEDDFRFWFWFIQSFQTAETHCNREKLSINRFSLFTCKLVVRDQSIINKKSSLLYWYKRRPPYNETHKPWTRKTTYKLKFWLLNSAVYIYIYIKLVLNLLVKLCAL